MTGGFPRPRGGFLERLLDFRRDRWEAICRGCGQCCYEKDRHGGKVVTNWRAPCRFLDLSTRRCTVYEERFSACPECRRMTVLHALFSPWLPPACGYVHRFRGGRVERGPRGVFQRRTNGSQ